MNEDLKPIAPQEEQSATVSEQVAGECVSGDVKEETVGQKIDDAKEAAADASGVAADAPGAVVDAVKDALGAASDAVAAAVEETVDFSTKSLKEIVDYFQQLIDGEDAQKLYKYAELIKASFYRTLKKEKIAMGFQPSTVEPAAAPASEPGKETSDAESEGANPSDAAAGQSDTASVSGEEAPAAETVSSNPFAEVERGFKDLFAIYRKKRTQFLEEQEKQREENLAKKQALIERLKELVEKQGDVSQAFPAFREIQNEWRATGPVPQANVKDTYETYQHNVEKFYDYVKINNELRDLDFKRNLEAKENLCSKAEALAGEENPVSAFRALQKLHEEWKELGPVSKEFRESIWARFKEATAVINKKHQEYFENQKGSQKENFEAKTKLCEKVEAIAASQVEDSNGWNNLSKEIENIQKEWKTIGFASKKENQRVYDRFRAACDLFFEKKRAFYSEFKDQMQVNMDKKIALCEQAEAIKDSEEWKKTAEKLVELQKQWKEIGPVSRKKSEQIWKRFRAACDAFFDRRDKHYGSQESEYSENLAAKLAIIEEVKAYEPTDDRETDFASLKAFQTRWNEIGFVPFKEKAKVQDAFKKALDAKFDDVRSSSDGRQQRYSGHRFADAASRADRAIRTERDRLVQKFVKKEQEIATWQNNMGFFSKSKNAEALLLELNKKIDIAKEELAQLEEKIKEFDKQYEEKDEQQQ